MRVASLGLALVLLGLSQGRASAAVEDAARFATKSEASKKDAKNKPLSDAQVRQFLIDESIAAYSGNCPCPYNTASNGSRCGRRSAYSRAGGDEPLCYPKDVSAEMVQAYRNRSVAE
jgi:hypothetical protein